jgi:hypothetical protein
MRVFMKLWNNVILLPFVLMYGEIILKKIFTSQIK